jgi:ABC-2 type transport system ATP-binding protein
VITVENLYKEFGRIRAVDGVSFDVAPGEVVGLLGPNGSGKTTIMRVLTGFFPPTSGRAWVAGIDVSSHALAARSKVGYLPENAVLYPDMRVSEYLAFCADVRQLRGPERVSRLAGVTRDCGLETVRSRLIGMLSKGFRQRVGLAQALLHDPEVLILDEPTVGLDPAQIVEIRNLIAALRGRTSVLFSTHILPEASTVCERVVIIDRGRLVAEDSAEGLLRALQRDERTLLRVAGPAVEVVAALRAVPGVDQVDEQPGPAPPSFVVHARDGEAVRPTLAAVVVGRGWKLVELRPITMTLEELFVAVVGQRRADA